MDYQRKLLFKYKEYEKYNSYTYNYESYIKYKC